MHQVVSVVYTDGKKATTYFWDFGMPFWQVTIFALKFFIYVCTDLWVFIHNVCFSPWFSRLTMDKSMFNLATVTILLYLHLYRSLYIL